MTEKPDITEADVEAFDHTMQVVDDLYEYAVEEDEPPFEPAVLLVLSKQLQQLHSALALVVGHDMALERAKEQGGKEKQ